MSLNLLDFDLRNIERLGQGVAAKQFLALLSAAVADCENREGESRARKVKLELELTPKTRTEYDENEKAITVFDGVNLKINIDSRLPSRKTMEYDLCVDEGRLLFNPNSPANWRQQSLIPSAEQLDRQFGDVPYKECPVNDPGR